MKMWECSDVREKGKGLLGICLEGGNVRECLLIKVILGFLGLLSLLDSLLLGDLVVDLVDDILGLVHRRVSGTVDHDVSVGEDLDQGAIVGLRVDGASGGGEGDAELLENVLDRLGRPGSRRRRGRGRRGNRVVLVDAGASQVVAARSTKAARDHVGRQVATHLFYAKLAFANLVIRNDGQNEFSIFYRLGKGPQKAD